MDRANKCASDFSAERRLAVTPEVAGWEHLTFRTYGFTAGRPIDGESASDEVCMVLLAGTASVTVGHQTWSLARDGEELSGPPHCLYMPPGERYLFEPRTDCEVAYARWPAQGLYPPRLIAPPAAPPEERGHGAGAYRVRTLLGPGEAEHLLCAEIMIPPGHWCLDLPLAPPDAPGRAVAPGSVCYCRFNAPEGWALSRHYDEAGGVDEALVIRHGDALILHAERYAVAAAPGSALYCLRIGAVVTAHEGADGEGGWLKSPAAG